MQSHERSQPPIAKLALVERRLLDRIGSDYQRVSFLRSGEPSLQSVMQHFSRSFVQEVEEIKYKAKDQKDMRTYLLSIEGTPGSGKTFLRQQLILPYMQVFQHIMKQQHGIDLHIVTLHWDSVEKKLEREGKIRRNRANASGAFLEMDTPGDLEIIAHEYKAELAELLRKRDPYTVIIADRLNGTGIKKGGVTVATRPYGSETTGDLLRSEGVFRDIPRSSVWVGAVGCVGSPATEVYTQYRQELMEAAPDLTRANQVNRRYRKPPMTQQQLELSTLAGSMQVVRVARARSWAIARFSLLDEDVSNRLPQYIRSIITSSRITNEQLAELGKTNDGITLFERVLSTAARLDIPWQGVLWRACHRLVEAILLEKSFLLDIPMGPQPDAASVVYNDPRI